MRSITEAYKKQANNQPQGSSNTEIIGRLFFFSSIIVCAIYTGRPNSKINANIKATLHYINGALKSLDATQLLSLNG